MTGILVIWNDCAAGREDAYEEWYQDEHLIERLSVSRFRVGRRYEAISATRQFFTTYEVENPGVLASAEYRERLANPTERTTAIMRDGFINMRRTICERRDIRGAIRGSVVVTIVLDGRSDPLQRLRDLAGRYPVGVEPTHSEIAISADRNEPNLSAEEALRGRDAKISGCLLLEFLRQEPALRVANQIRDMYAVAETGVFRLLCSLRRDDLA